MSTVSVKTVTFNGGKYKIWSVGGKVTLAKCCKTGKFIGHKLAGDALWHNRNKTCLIESQAQNTVIVNTFAQVDASINWFGIVGGLFLAIAIAFLATLFGFAVSENHGSMFLIGMMLFAVLSIAPLILMDAKMVSCEIV